MKRGTKRFVSSDDETRRQFLSKGLFALAAARLNWSTAVEADALSSSQHSQSRKAKNMSLSVQQISDRLEIQDVLTRYCYAVDDRDWDTYRQLFAPDAVIDTITGGIKSGVEEHVARLVESIDVTARDLDGSCRAKWKRGQDTCPLLVSDRV